MTTKEKAIKKLEIELLEKHTDMETKFFEWIVEQEDEEMFKGILEDAKSLKNARQYAYNQACKIQVGGCAAVIDSEVYNWVSEYFKNPVIIASAGKLEKEKKVEKKHKAPVNTVKKAENVQPKQSERKMMEGEQLDLLDFL